MPDAVNAQPTGLPLRDIHLPEAISWWPPAPGWWLLLVLIMVVGLLMWWYRRRKSQARVRVAALAEWRALLDAFQQEQNEQHLVQGLSQLLRRVLLSYYPRTELASLKGEAWLAYLDAHFTTRQDRPFSRGAGKVLMDAPYQRHVACDVYALHALCGEWLTALPPLKGRVND